MLYTGIVAKNNIYFTFLVFNTFSWVMLRRFLTTMRSANYILVTLKAMTAVIRIDKRNKNGTTHETLAASRA